ncbi:MAG TPA: hypothetical protein ENJ23_05060 [Bacteroidetes bacterium]|nr:hypothetical protein [Bacteroidota bacterium]
MAPGIEAHFSPDTLNARSPELSRLARQLDSLNRRQLEIDRSLDTLRLQAQQVRREQIKSDVINLLLLAAIAIFASRFILRFFRR